MHEEYLKTIDRVIAQGPYSDTWASLCSHPVPDWYMDGKFGIFIHWGVYSVPAFGSEWYPRNMYQQGSREFEHHVATYGPQKEFGYKDFIPMFKAEKFDAAEWMELFEAAGAKYVMPVAEHHDGFQMYKSDISHFNAYEMGPHRDVVGELKADADKRGIALCCSNHRMEHYWFMEGGLDFDSDVQDPANSEFYGGAYGNVHHGPQNTHDLRDALPTTEFLDDWLVRNCEIVDRYHPRIMWFDWWIHNPAAKPYLRRFAAYYYNRAAEWGEQVTINYKYDAYMRGSGVFDIERGQLSAASPRFWQNDTAIAKNSWGYTENNDFKNPVDLVCDLIDIVSKNGALLLNVGPRADGTITDEDKRVLLAIGDWLRVNGEAIYGTRVWNVFGEGPTEVPEGAFTDVNRPKFTGEDIRFTYKPGYVYAHVLAQPEDGVVRVKSMHTMSDAQIVFGGIVTGVSLLGGGELEFERTGEALVARLPEGFHSDYPIVLKIAVD